MTNIAQLTTRFARRPLLLYPPAAAEITQHLAMSDPRGMRSESRLDAVLRKVGLARPKPLAMEDAEYEDTPPPSSACYEPLWAQQRYGDPVDTGTGWALFNGVGFLEIDGALSDKGGYYCGDFYHGYDTVLAALREMDDDARVQGVFIRMCSPGGPATSGLTALSQFMRTMRASSGGKPIHIYCDMACSAGYWITAPADFISAGSMGLVGSIGAVIVHYDYSGMAKQAGLVVTPIQFGSKKTDAAPWKPLSDEALADLQAEIDQLGRDFVADVAKSRPQLTAEALIDTQAGVFLAQHDDPARSGLALGFVDAVETEEEAFDRLLSVISGVAAVDFTPPPQAFTAETPQPAPQTKKDTDMVKQLTSTTSRAALSTASAAPQPKAAAGNETEIDPEAAVDDDDDDDDLPVDPNAPIDDEDNVASEDPKASAHAREIAMSAEGKAHPDAALSAIEHGLTLTQFKGMVAALPSASAAPAAPQATAFERHMAKTKSLAPDAPQEAAKTWGSALVDNAKGRRGA